MEDIDPTNKGKKNTWKLHMYFLSVAKGKRKKKRERVKRLALTYKITLDYKCDLLTKQCYVRMI